MILNRPFSTVINPFQCVALVTIKNHVFLFLRPVIQNKSPHQSSNKERNCLLLLQPCRFHQQSIKSHWAVCHWQTSVSSCCQWKLMVLDGILQLFRQSIGALLVLTFFLNLNDTDICVEDMLMTGWILSNIIIWEGEGLGSRGDDWKVKKKSV